MAAGSIRTAIWNKFIADDSAALTDALDSTRFYYKEADQDIDIPYCIFHIFNEIYDFTFDLDFEEVLIQFDYYATSASDCDTGITDIKSMFDYAALTITGYTCLRMERTMVMNSSKDQPDDIWHGIVRYELLIQKT